MGRRHDNARPRTRPRRLDLTVTETGAPLPDPQTPPTGERNHAFRAAAKYAPSRVTSRMYAKVASINAALDAAEQQLGRVYLPAAQRHEVGEHLRAYRARVVQVRDKVADAAHSRIVADEVKAELATLGGLTQLLEPAVIGLAHQVRADRGLPEPAPSPGVAARNGVLRERGRAAVAAVLAALGCDQPGQVSAALTQLRAVTVDATQVAW